MGIEDINISETLETNAPSIKYSGNEGPKSPEEERMMAQKMAAAMEDQAMADEQMMSEDEMMAGVDYSSRAFREKLIGQLMDAGGLDYGSASVEADRIIEIKLRPKRTKAAFGGIMGVDGRRQYGLGSKFKKFVRKIIPNEVAAVAEKAAPFVAPFNPAVAGLMSGIGGFDRTGKIGSSIKSGLLNYGLGQAGRYIGGAGFQGNPFSTDGGAFRGGLEGFKGGFSKPTGDGGIKKLFNKSTPITNNSTSAIGKEEALQEIVDKAAIENLPLEKQISEKAQAAFIKNTQAPNLNLLQRAKQYIPTSLADLGTKKGAMGAIGLASLAGGLYTKFGGEEETIDAIMDRGEGLDLVDIRTRVTEAFKDPSGKKLAALRVEFPYLGTQASKNTAIMAQGGRIGYAMGGYTTGGTGFNKPGYLGGMATRMPMEEGGIMDLGGMEKDYRAEGGFVPIGKKEKADDVPARLSVNEFVFTADAVRNAGGGDIDKGAEVMENMMKNLEAGGEVSEESQGMQGARDMFQTAQTLEGIM